MLLSLMFLTAGLGAGEINLVDNAGFQRGLDRWRHEENGTVEIRDGAARLSGGKLVHEVDLDNMAHSDPAATLPCDRVFRLSMRAKGPCTVRLGIRSLIMRGANLYDVAEHWSAPVKVGPAWQNLVWEDSDHGISTVFHDRLMVEHLEGEPALLDDFSFFYLDRSRFSIRFTPAHVSAVPGEKIRLSIDTSGAPAGRRLRLVFYPGEVIQGASPREEWFTPGIRSFEFIMPARCEGGIRIAVSDPETGTKGIFFATLFPLAELKRFRSMKTSSRYRHILFLGDSLSDYDRGRNYIDLVSEFLPPGVTVRNAGVGGDFCQRVWDRLNGKPGVWRPEMYSRLFQPEPDLIFILLGANDAKSRSDTGYETPLTPPGKQKELLGRIIAFLREKTNARVVIIGPAQGYFPFQSERAADLRAGGITHSLFGIRKHTERFNAVAKALAGEKDFINFYRISADAPDPRELYVPNDGIHLSGKGHRLLAGAILSFLAEPDAEKR